MRYFTDFLVAGSGMFPVDMLRYDACYPIHSPTNIEGGERRVVALRHRHDNKVTTKPTQGRWESFAWRVIEVKTYRQGQPASIHDFTRITLDAHGRLILPEEDAS